MESVMPRIVGVKDLIARWYDGVLSGLRGDLPGRYRERAVSTDEWIVLFGQDNLDRVSDLLRDICDALALREHTRFQLRPTDRVIDIYNERYANSLSVDMLELETLIDTMRRDHGIALRDDAWETITFGDLVATVLNGPRHAER